MVLKNIGIGGLCIEAQNFTEIDSIQEKTTSSCHAAEIKSLHDSKTLNRNVSR